MYVIPEAHLERLGQMLGPQALTTGTGMHISYHATAGKRHIAWKSWQPEQPHNPALLCVPGAHMGLEVFEPLAFWLAEHGVPCHALSFPDHGRGWGYSWDMELLTEGQMTLSHEALYIGRVVEEVKDKVILVGAGLGGIAAQLYAQQHSDQIAGLVLLGSCLPALAAGVWPSPLPGQHPVPGPPGATLARWLGHDASERDVETLAALLCPETLVIEPSTLERWSGGYTGPTLVLAGEHDPYVQATALQATAAHYQTEPAIIIGAALLMWGKHWPEGAERILAFCQAISGISGVS